MPHGAKGKGPHPWKEGTKKGPWDRTRDDTGPEPLPHPEPPKPKKTWTSWGGDLNLQEAFKDPDLVGSQNEITEFDGATFGNGGNESTSGAGGTGGNPLAGNKLRALKSATKPTRRIGRKKSEKGPGRSRVY